MRGSDQHSGSLFSYVDIEARIAAGHPLRQIRELVNEALGQLDRRFAGLYAEEGRPSIPPERLLSELAAIVLLDPFGEAADGAAGFRPSVPLVCRPGDRRSGVRPGCATVP
jgi:hypothetical protein